MTTFDGAVNIVLATAKAAAETLLRDHYRRAFYRRLRQEFDRLELAQIDGRGAADALLKIAAVPRDPIRLAELDAGDCE